MPEVPYAAQWMRGVGAMLLRNALMLEAEFGTAGIIPPDQAAKAEKLIEACKDVLRAESAWHGSAMADILLGKTD